MKEFGKVLCDACYWTGTNADLLTAGNPFVPDEIIRACPECFQIEKISMICDEPGCTKQASCGWPSPEDGYRWTCGDHWREVRNAIEDID